MDRAVTASFPYGGVMGAGYFHPTSGGQTQSRKSRVCAYCRKVFTRSTTRRYHEAKCKIKEMGDNGIGTSKAQVSPIAPSYAPTRSPLTYRVHTDVTTDICNNNVPLLPKNEVASHAMTSAKQFRPDTISIVQNYCPPPPSALFEDVSPVNSSPALPPVNWLLPASMHNTHYNHDTKTVPKQEYESKILCHTSSGVLFTSADRSLSPQQEIKPEQPLSSQGLYQCHICGSATPLSERCHCLERAGTDYKPYTCVICLMQFTRKYTLKLHEKRHLPPFTCNFCQKQFPGHISQLKDHLLSHNVSSRGNYMGTLMNHDDEKPGEVKQEVSCSDDDDSNDNSSLPDVTMKAKLSNDERETESANDVQKCNQCGQEFAHAYLLKVHVKIHATKPFECPVCGKKFGYRNNMKTHIKCHYGTKAHACDRCGARFTRASTLRRHIEKHFSPDNGNSSGKLTVSGQVRDLPQSSGISRVPLMSPVMSVMNQLPQPSFVQTAEPNKHPCWLPISINAYNSEFVNPMSTWPFTGVVADPNITRNVEEIKDSMKLPLVENYEPQTQALNLTTPKSDSSLQNSDKSPTDTPKSRETPELGEIYRAASSERETVYLPDVMSYTQRNTESTTRSTRDVHIQVNSCQCSMAAIELSVQNVNETEYRSESTPEEENHEPVRNSPIQIPNSPKPTDDEINEINSNSDEVSFSDETKVPSQDGHLFPCIPCGIYFCDYAMLKIHRRLHAPGLYRAYICALCGEDCRDKVYFSLHINEHLNYVAEKENKTSL